MKITTALLASFLFLNFTHATEITCADTQKNLEIKIAKLDRNVIVSPDLSVTVIKNGKTNKFARSEAVYTGEINPALHPDEVQPLHDQRYIISNFSQKSSGEELLQSVWRLKIDTTGNASLIVSGSSLLDTPEYKIQCK